MQNSKGLERMQLVMAFEPADLNSTGATGDYVCLSHYDRCLCVILAGDGTASKDIPVSMYQATSNAGAGAKVLNALETGRIYTKEGATFTAMQLVDQFTKETQATADEQWAPGDSGENVLVWGFEIKASDLDIAGGFDCIRMDVADPGAAKIVAGLYILLDPEYPSAPELMASCVEEPGGGSVYS